MDKVFLICNLDDIIETFRPLSRKKHSQHSISIYYWVILTLRFTCCRQEKKYTLYFFLITVTVGLSKLIKLREIVFLNHLLIKLRILNN